MNSHTFWPREVIWLYIVYFTKLFIETNVKDTLYLELGFVIEIAYSFCLRKRDIEGFSL